MECGLPDYTCVKDTGMAIVSTNPLVNGLSGMLGKTLVFKTFHGKTIVSSRPRPPRKESARQKENRSKFKQASAWARHILLDPKQKAYYQQKARQLLLPNAYTAAIADYMRKPVIKAITRHAEMQTYSVLKKDFKLKRIVLEINRNAETGASMDVPLLPDGSGVIQLKIAELPTARLTITDMTGQVFIMEQLVK